MTHTHIHTHTLHSLHCYWYLLHILLNTHPSQHSKCTYIPTLTHNYRFKSLFYLKDFYVNFTFCYLWMSLFRKQKWLMQNLGDIESLMKVKLIWLFSSIPHYWPNASPNHEAKYIFLHLIFIFSYFYITSKLSLSLEKSFFLWSYYKIKKAQNSLVKN